MTYQDPQADHILPPDQASWPELTDSEALELIASWTDLTPTRQRDLASAVSVAAETAKAQGASPVLTPAALRKHVLTRSAAALGISESRMRNVRSALRFVLRRLDLLDRADTPLTSPWAALLDRLDERRRPALIGLARFCSGRAIAPEHVDRPVLEAFLAQLTERTLTPKPRKQAGSVRMAWNRACAHIEGWPGKPLPRFDQADQFILPIDKFPTSFRQDLDRFGARLAATGLEDVFADPPEGEDEDAALPLPARPLRASSVALRQSHARWAASALVMTGVPIEEVTSLTSLVTPLTRTKEIIRFLYNRAGNKPSAAGSHVAELLSMVAKYDARLPKLDVQKIATWGRNVKLTYTGMTEKNQQRINAAMEPKHYDLLLALPTALMATARRLRPTAPRQAASIALRAVALQFLSYIPLRLANVVGLRLDSHLQRSDPRRGPIHHVMIPLDETKNSRAINMPVSKETSSFLEEWIRDFRPLVAAADCRYLFPGHGTGDRPMTPQALRDAIKKITRELVGVELSPHQFRHLAAHRFLKAFPGQYEVVRQLLGQACLDTTVRYYSGTDSEASTRLYDDAILRRHLQLRRPPAGLTALSPRRTKRKGG